MSNQYILDLLLYSPSIEDYSSLEYSNKVILNQKILNEIMNNNIQEDTMIFKLWSQSDIGYYETFVSVHDFTASDDKIYVPFRIAEELFVNRDDFINIEYYIPPKANYIKLKPNQKEFYNIIDVKDFLGNHIKKYYPVLKKDSIISIPYYDSIIELVIKDIKPFDVVTTIDTDIQVEFEPFNEVDTHNVNVSNSTNIHDDIQSYDKKMDEWYPFCGVGHRLGNK